MSEHLEVYRQFRERPANDDCLPVEQLDGLLTATVLTPDIVEPVEFIPLIWGPGAPDFATDIEENAIFDGIYARLHEIERDLRVEGPVVPVLDTTADDGGAAAWAKGFSQGMNIRHWLWDKLINDDQNMQLLAPIVAHLDDKDGMPLPTSSGRSINEVRKEAAAIIPAALTTIDLFFQMRPNAAPPAKSPKVGRNDPCPCGSGKKYKKCCLQ